MKELLFRSYLDDSLPCAHSKGRGAEIAKDRKNKNTLNEHARNLFIILTTTTIDFTIREIFLQLFTYKTA